MSDSYYLTPNVAPRQAPVPTAPTSTGTSSATSSSTLASSSTSIAGLNPTTTSSIASSTQPGTDSKMASPSSVVSTSSRIPGSSGAPTIPIPSGNGTGNGTAGTEIPNPSSGVSSAAAGGIAVACIVAGVVIGVIAALCFLRKKKRGRRGRHGRSGGLELDGIAPQYQQQSPHHQQGQGHHQPVFDLSLFLLDSTPNKDILYELSSKSQMIEQHVDNEYHTNHISAGHHELTQALRGLGFDASSPPFSPDYVASLALDGRTRRAALRHVLSFVVFSSMDLESARHRPSLLPPPVVDFVRMSQPASRRDEDPEMTARATSQWRILSAYLLHPNRSERTPLTLVEAAVAPQAAALAALLTGFLAPFARSSQATELQAVLQDILLDAASLGYKLFSQPNEWRFEHSPGPAHGGGVERVVVVCPGLSKLSESDGDGLNTPSRRLLVAPVVLRV